MLGSYNTACAFCLNYEFRCLVNSLQMNCMENPGTIIDAQLSNKQNHSYFSILWFFSFQNITPTLPLPSPWQLFCSRNLLVLSPAALFDFASWTSYEECGARISEHPDSASAERQKGNVDLLPAERGPSRWACTQTTQNIKHSQLKSLAVTGDETLHRREAF